MMLEKPSAIYQIMLSGVIDPEWSDWLGALSVRSETGSDGRPYTILVGPVSDQAALRGILIKCWDLNLELVSLEKRCL